MYGFMCGLGNQIITHVHHLGAFNHAGEVTSLNVTALDAAQYDRKANNCESRQQLLQHKYGPILKKVQANLLGTSLA